MKFLGVIAFALALASGLCYHTNDEHSGDLMKELMVVSTKYYQSTMKKLDPYHMPDISDAHFAFKEFNVNVTYSATNRTIAGLSDFVINKVETAPRRLKGRMEITYPAINVVGDYEVHGILFNRTASGKGQYTTKMTNFTAVIDIQVEERRHFGHLSTRIVHLKQFLNMPELAVSYKGLKVEGMTEQEVDQAIEKEGIAWFDKVKTRMARISSDITKQKINKSWRGLSIKVIIDWLKKHTKDENNNANSLDFNASDYLELFREV